MVSEGVENLPELSSSEEITPFQELEIKVNDAKMFFTMCLAICYVFSMSVVCGHFYTDKFAFTG